LTRQPPKQRRRNMRRSLESRADQCCLTLTHCAFLNHSLLILCTLPGRMSRRLSSHCGLVTTRGSARGPANIAPIMQPGRLVLVVQPRVQRSLRRLGHTFQMFPRRDPTCYHDSRPFAPFHDEVILPTHAHSLICLISFFFLYSFQQPHHKRQDKTLY